MNFVQRVESIALQSAYDMKMVGWQNLYILFNYRPRHEYWTHLLELGFVDEDVYELADEHYGWSRWT